MNLQSKSTKPSLHTSSNETKRNDFDTAEGVFIGSLAGGLAWLLAFIVVGAIAVGW
jgi:hypothetical protein